MKPIIFCCPDEERESKGISLNVSIAKELISVKPIRKSSLMLPKIVDTIIAELPKNSTIKDFDVLFNPDYQIDVLQFLIAACKKREFSIIWSGTYSNGKLIYAEPGYADFKTYDLDKYDVTCIV